MKTFSQTAATIAGVRFVDWLIAVPANPAAEASVFAIISIALALILAATGQQDRRLNRAN